jgi:hypothetical protein
VLSAAEFGGKVSWLSPLVSFGMGSNLYQAVTFRMISSELYASLVLASLIVLFVVLFDFSGIGFVVITHSFEWKLVKLVSLLDCTGRLWCIGGRS